MANNIYIGGTTNVTTTTTTTTNITSSNISNFFTVTNSSYYFAGSGSTFTSNNNGVNSSTAQTVLTAKQDCTVSFSYSYSSEANYDEFTLIIGSETIENAVSGATTNKSVSNKTLTSGQTITFKYSKDGSVNSNDDRCTFSNMTCTVQTTATETKTNVAIEPSKFYIGVNGIARKAKKIYYGGPDNIARCVWGGGFNFGEGNGEAADAQWLLDLATYLRNGNSGASIGNIVGKTKTITLTSPVLGTTSHLIRVIGVDQDAPNTVTWQTANCLANTITFGSNAVWIGSTARTQCQNYYNAFPAKSAIMTVSKGTCPNTNDSRAGTATYNNETVWLPSEREMGLDEYAPISTANSTTSNAECTRGRNFSYSYYTSDNSRIKKKSDSGSAEWYWERSRDYYTSGDVCGVYSDGKASSGKCGSRGGLAPAYVIG